MEQKITEFSKEMIMTTWERELTVRWGFWETGAVKKTPRFCTFMCVSLFQRHRSWRGQGHNSSALTGDQGEIGPEVGKRSRFSGPQTIVSEGISECEWIRMGFNLRPPESLFRNKRKRWLSGKWKAWENNTGFCLNKNSFLEKLILLCSKSKPELRRSQVLQG